MPLTANPTNETVLAARAAKRIAYANAHGFRAVMADDGSSITVEIPYSGANGAKGTMWETATTFEELRAILGY